MKKTVLLIGFLGCCFVLFSQNQIHVDGSVSNSGSGSTSSPYKTIQAAVNAASNGDIIKVAKGTYAEAVEIKQKKVQLLGGFAGGGNYGTANPQANVTIINGTSAAPCIYVQIDEREISGKLTISGFTIRNGQRGIELAEGWSPHLNNITIENNIIENNGLQTGDQRGGGIGLEGNNVTIQNNIIRNNRSGRGAAIGSTRGSQYASVNFLIADNRIENNIGYEDHAGGAFICGTGTITRNIFDGNEAARDCGYGWGGGILIFADSNTKTTVSLSFNVWRNNQAPDRGGAVFIDDGASVKMEHELLYNNKSKSSGSAVYVDDLDGVPSVLEMNNCTISGNPSGGAALYVEASTASVQNSIFWDNGKDFETVDGGRLTVTYTLTQQGYTGTGNITSNPMFVNPANGNFHLQGNSPAIDAGNPASDYSKEPAPNGGRVNMGCYGNTPEATKSGSAGIDDITQQSWTMFPNPANEYVTIDRLPGSARVHIFDLTGKSVYSAAVESEQTTISTGHFANGIYIVQIVCNGTVESRKLIVKK